MNYLIASASAALSVLTYAVWQEPAMPQALQYLMLASCAYGIWFAVKLIESQE